MRKNEKIIADLKINGFTKKGHGVGVSETNKIAEVPFCIPGDEVKASMFRKRQGVYSSELIEILKPSPLRIAPKCIHFGKCGGCRLQQISYEEQLKIKQEYVEKLFSQEIENLPGLCRPIIPCDPPWKYRNKMEFSFSSDISGNEYLGLIIDSSRGKVLNLTECHLVNPWFIDCLKAVKNWWSENEISAYHAHSNRGSLRTLTVREGMRSGDRLVMLTVSGNPAYALKKEQLDSYVTFVKKACEESLPANATLSIFLRIQQAVKGMPTEFYEMQLYGKDHIRETLHISIDSKHPSIPLNFKVSPSAFFQPNTYQAEKLYSKALQMLDITPGSVVYDLYCGTGTLGICAATLAKQIVGIEISPESSLDARTNAKENNLTNVIIHTGPVADVMTKIRESSELPNPDVIMVDPPRVGLDPKTISHLIELKPKKILYISCNPATQVDNIRELQKQGYRLRSLQPVDQFPHTMHIENIAILSLP